MMSISTVFGKTKLIALIVCALFLSLAITAYADMPPCGGNPEANVFVEYPEIFELTKNGSAYHLSVKLGSTYGSATEIAVWPAVDADGNSIATCAENAGTWECDYSQSQLKSGFENIVVVDFIAVENGSKCLRAWVKGFLVTPATDRPASDVFEYVADQTPEPTEDDPIIKEEEPLDSTKEPSDPNLNPKSNPVTTTPAEEETPALDEETSDNPYDAMTAMEANQALAGKKGGGACSLNAFSGVNTDSFINLLMLLIPALYAIKKRKGA